MYTYGVLQLAIEWSSAWAQVWKTAQTWSDYKRCIVLVRYPSTNSAFHPALREELMRQHRQSNTNIFRCDAWRLGPVDHL